MSISSLSPFPARDYALVDAGACRNFIGGRWVDAVSGATLDVENPRHGRVMGTVAWSGADDVDAAVQAAVVAQRDWRRWPLRERAQVLYRLRELLVRDLDELAWQVAHENGKTFAEGRASVEKGIECVEYGCAVANAIPGETLEVSRGVTCRVDHEPLGVVAGISPFNFPVMVPLWMIPQALVAGNAFVLKPSELVPFGAQKLAALLQEAGLPDGIFSVVNGGPDVVNALCDHPSIQAIGFVGSTKVARHVYARAAANGKSALCLGGAKNHLILVPDADLALSAQNIVASFTGGTGQRCMAASVLLAVGDVEPILDAVVAEARKIVLGRDMGAVITAGAEKRIRGYIDAAEAAGAVVRLDGRGVRGPDPGHWVGPTVLDHVTPDMPCAREEIFGPVLSIVRCRTVDEALAIENANPYGNAACVYTTSGAVAEYVIQRVEAGMCGVNVGVPVPREPFGFGGWNQSRFGVGNLTGHDGYRFWTRPRKVTTKWALQKDTTWMG